VGLKIGSASRILLRSPGFPEVGVYKTHGPLDDGWGDVVMVDDELA